METKEAAPVQKNNTLALVLVSVLIAALAAGGSVYAYQHSQQTKSQLVLQAQIDTLKSQLAESQKATPTPTPVAATIPLSTATPSAVATPIPVPLLTSAQLQNFTYKDMNGISRTLKNGSATYPVNGFMGSLGSSLGKTYPPVYGDLNGDGISDAVVVLGDNEGGTGYWYDLAVVLDKNGSPVLGGETVVLDDRANIQSITVSDGLITVNGMEVGPGQPLSDPGNVPKTERYKLVGGNLLPQ